MQQQAEDIDVIIVGSGPSGGRIARELTRRGLRVTMLEAGPDLYRTTFPRSEADYTGQLYWNGGIEIASDGRLGLLRGRVVGGTSIVNQALLDRFDDVAWDDWRARTGIDWMGVDAMEPHYAACASEAAISEVPHEHWNRNTEIYTNGCDELGYCWKPLTRGQRDCALGKGSDCIACLGGCRRDSKQSALVTTIAAARADGLRVIAGCEVDRIEWRSTDDVRVIASMADGERVEHRAPKVVLAAGALGNTSILLRSKLRSALPALGRGFACHPQVMTYGVFAGEHVDSHKGAFQAVKSADPRLRELGVKLENVFAPPIGTSMLLPGTGRTLLRRMRRYREMASIEVAVRDQPAGRIRVDRKGRTVVDKQLTRSDRDKAAKGVAIVRQILERAGASEVIETNEVFGLHLMGGCAIGTKVDRAVVTPEFHLFDHPNIFAVDSSVFPAAPGINPSFTVMALAHRAAEAVAVA
jgi:choline dehydrogenase-like flavoprotein